MNRIKAMYDNRNMKHPHHMKQVMKIMAAAAAAAALTASSHADVIAYWAQNDNSLSDGGSGFQEGDFPQAVDTGAGVLTVGGGNILATDEKGVYLRIQSFAGTALNALDDFGPGGSIVFQGGADSENNGAWMQFEFMTRGYREIVLSFATRRTGTGFDANQISYSFDGERFTDFGEPYDPSSDWELKHVDFGDLLDEKPSVFVRITFDGATSTIGNNRLDNILLEGDPTGEEEQPACPEDLTGDGGVNVFDLLALLEVWGDCPGCREDLTGDGGVTVFDLLALLDAWGECP